MPPADDAAASAVRGLAGPRRCVAEAVAPRRHRRGAHERWSRAKWPSAPRAQPGRPSVSGGGGAPSWRASSAIHAVAGAGSSSQTLTAPDPRPARRWRHRRRRRRARSWSPRRRRSGRRPAAARPPCRRRRTRCPGRRASRYRRTTGSATSPTARSSASIPRMVVTRARPPRRPGARSRAPAHRRVGTPRRCSGRRSGGAGRVGRVDEVARARGPHGGVGVAAPGGQVRELVDDGVRTGVLHRGDQRIAVVDVADDRLGPDGAQPVGAGVGPAQRHDRVAGGDEPGHEAAADTPSPRRRRSACHPSVRGPDGCEAAGIPCSSGSRTLDVRWLIASSEGRR